MFSFNTLFWDPSEGDVSCVKTRVSQPSLVNPVGKAKCFSFVRQENIISFVSALFGLCSPPTIIRGVVQGVVNSINGVLAGWSWPHIFEKCSEAISPLIAHCNTSPTPQVKERGFLVITPSFHAKPVGVLWHLFCLSTNCSSVVFVGMKCKYFLLLYAPTRLRVAPLKVCAIDNLLFSTVAQTSPQRQSPSFTRKLYNGESSKSFVGEVFNRARAAVWSKIASSHDVVPYKQWIGEKPARVDSTGGLRYFNLSAVASI